MIARYPGKDKTAADYLPRLKIRKKLSSKSVKMFEQTPLNLMSNRWESQTLTIFLYEDETEGQAWQPEMQARRNPVGQTTHVSIEKFISQRSTYHRLSTLQILTNTNTTAMEQPMTSHKNNCVSNWNETKTQNMFYSKITVTNLTVAIQTGCTIGRKIIPDNMAKLVA